MRKKILAIGFMGTLAIFLLYILFNLNTPVNATPEPPAWTSESNEIPSEAQLNKFLRNYMFVDGAERTIHLKINPMDWTLYTEEAPAELNRFWIKLVATPHDGPDRISNIDEVSFGLKDETVEALKKIEDNIWVERVKGKSRSAKFEWHISQYGYYTDNY